ncbi:MAG: phospholipase effector Tle1 domain-containing protein [Pseudonocardiaceae bacterium]
MRHLVVCCDGTWNTPEEEAATNVYRLHNALADTADDGTEQLRYYDHGVGTEGGLADYVLGGAAGAGLSRNVLDAYYWLTTTYQPGDRIALFGFSRGAYTGRSLAGMIATCGLLDTTSLNDAMVWNQIDRVYHRRYQRGDRASPRWRHGLRFSYDPEHADQIPVHFIGVWDTVGSLGIPDYLGWLNLLDPLQIP